MEYVPVAQSDISAVAREARFRLCVYGASAKEDALFDIIGASVEDALEGAHNLSEEDRRLWSLAIVDAPSLVDASRPSLTWISGFDYHALPATPAEWRGRGQMQVRYLSAKVLRGEDPVLPNGLRVVRMFPGWGSEIALWESFTDMYVLEPGDLPLGEKLEQELVDWNLEWESYGLEADRPKSWVEKGWILHSKVQAALEEVAEVRPEFE